MTSAAGAAIETKEREDEHEEKDKEEDGATTTTTTTTRGDAPNSDPDVDADIDVPNGGHHTLITEGSVRLLLTPSDVDAVFYNPVQVQTRDLSVLMIALYAERRLKSRAVRARKKELLEELRLRGVPQEEWDVQGLEIRAEAEMDQVDWRERAAARETREGGIRILEALAASGLRSLRYWREVPGVRQVVINDLDDAAVDLARRTVAFNGLNDDLCPPCSYYDDVVEHREEGSYSYDGIRVQQEDATHEMYVSRRPPTLRPENYTPTQRHRQRDQYDVIDLDPYGSASPFLDGAVQAIVSGGLLCVTCTDMQELGGAGRSETCYGRYTGVPVQGAGYCQELALRILLKDVATCAARYGRAIRPVLSVGMAFYVRVFVEVVDDKKGVSNLSLSVGSVYQSVLCPSFHTVPHGTLGQHGSNRSSTYQPSLGPAVPRCSETGGPFMVAGPAWLGPLHDMDVVKEAVRRLEVPNGKGTGVLPLATRTRLVGLLTSVSEELPDVPLYYTLPDLCETLGCVVSPRLKAVRAALVNAGYRVSGYHREPQAIKTDAPSSVVWDVMRAWCKEHPPKARGKGRGSKKERRAERRKQQQEHKREGGKIGYDANGSSGGGKAMAQQPVEKSNVDKDELRFRGDDKGEAKTGDSGKNSGHGGSSSSKHSPNPASLILAKEPDIKVDFTIPDGFEQNRKKAQRFPHNPKVNWGPKPMASGAPNN